MRPGWSGRACPLTVGEPATERVLPPPLDGPPDMERLIPMASRKRDGDPRATRASARALGLRRHQEAALLLEHVGPELGARLAEAPPDPGSVVALREPRVRVLEPERHRYDPPRPVRLDVDQEEQAEVVAEGGVDGVVVKEVAEVVED